MLFLRLSSRGGSEPQWGSGAVRDDRALSAESEKEEGRIKVMTERKT